MMPSRKGRFSRDLAVAPNGENPPLSDIPLTPDWGSWGRLASPFTRIASSATATDCSCANRPTSRYDSELRPWNCTPSHSAAAARGTSDGGPAAAGHRHLALEAKPDSSGIGRLGAGPAHGFQWPRLRTRIRHPSGENWRHSSAGPMVAVRRHPAHPVKTRDGSRATAGRPEHAPSRQSTPLRRHPRELRFDD
jgi:hypothetical protein